MKVIQLPGQCLCSACGQFLRQERYVKGGTPFTDHAVVSCPNPACEHYEKLLKIPFVVTQAELVP